MSATKAFDMVVAAYQEATGQSAKEAKQDVAVKLAKAWALEAFGSGVATRVGRPAADHLDGQTAIEIPEEGATKPKKKGGKK